jgi:hypothetical protein
MTNQWLPWVLILLMLGIIIWNYFRRRKGGQMTYDMAMGVYANVEDCLRTVEVRLSDPLSKKKFAMASWHAFSKQMNFLNPELLNTLTEAFTLAEECNRRIDEARKSNTMNTMSSLQDLPLERLKTLMLKGREGLMLWLRNAQSSESQNTRRGCMGL